MMRGQAGEGGERFSRAPEMEASTRMPMSSRPLAAISACAAAMLRNWVQGIGSRFMVSPNGRPAAARMARLSALR
jgi:hypothetical protein